MIADPYADVRYWLYLGTMAQLAYASTLDGYVIDRPAPKARLKIHAGFATRKQAMAAQVLINKRFPALTKMINPEPLFLSADQMAALDFNERKRKALWKGIRCIRATQKPWDVYLRIKRIGEGFSDPSEYSTRVRPGAYGPLPMPWEPDYAAGEVSGWLRDRGYLIEGYKGSHIIQVTRNTALDLKMAFYRRS